MPTTIMCEMTVDQEGCSNYWSLAKELERPSLWNLPKKDIG